MPESEVVSIAVINTAPKAAGRYHGGRALGTLGAGLSDERWRPLLPTPWHSEVPAVPDPSVRITLCGELNRLNVSPRGRMLPWSLRAAWPRGVR